MPRCRPQLTARDLELVRIDRNLQRLTWRLAARIAPRALTLRLIDVWLDQRRHVMTRPEP